VNGPIEKDAEVIVPGNEPKSAATDIGYESGVEQDPCQIGDSKFALRAG
jgi:hypothetical protein